MIETVSLHARLGTENQFIKKWTVRTSTNGVYAYHAFPIHRLGGHYWQGGLSAKLYADEGTEVRMIVSSRGGLTGVAIATGSITGYEVDMP